MPGALSWQCKWSAECQSAWSAWSAWREAGVPGVLECQECQSAGVQNTTAIQAILAIPGS